MKVALAFVLLIPAAAAAQGGQLQRAEMTGEVANGSASARVEIEYRLKTARGTRTIPVRGLLAFDTRLGDVEAQVGAWRAPLALQSETPPLVTGSITLPPDVSADSTLHVTLRYTVEGAVARDGDRFHVALPVLFVDWKPAAAPANTFVSRSRLPRGFVVGEGFPSVPRRRTAEADAHVYELSLQVIPAFVSFRGQTGGGPLLPLDVALDLLILPILLGLGALTWVLMRRDHFWLPGDSSPVPPGKDT